MQRTGHDLGFSREKNLQLVIEACIELTVPVTLCHGHTRCGDWCGMDFKRRR